MPVTKIQIKPGVVRETTSLANEGGWYYCNKIRFRSGNPESIGGWIRVLDDTYLGTCTALFPWVILTGDSPMGVGTNIKYYLERGGGLYDITPIRASSTINANPFAIASGSNTITVTDTSHGALLGDYVTFSGAATVGNVTDTILNAEFVIQSVVDANTYTIVYTGTAASSTTSGGGASVVAAYQAHVGLAIYVPGIGWGANPWGSGTWGGGGAIGAGGQLRLWTQGAFGEDLVFCDRNVGIYYWDASGGFGTRAILLTAIAGASDVPTIATAVTVTDTRHVVAFGSNPVGSSTQDPLMVRWSDTESASDWTPTAVNTAGGYRLGYGNYIVSYAVARQETLIWTESTLYSMQFIGGDLEFGFYLLGADLSVMGPNATAVANNVTYWMGKNKFYTYDGTIKTLNCDVRQTIFDNLNMDQAYQVCAGVNEFFTEITWFYCSTGQTVIDSYVTYNYAEGLWYFGTMSRSAWVNAGVRNYPVAADPTTNLLYYHEAAVDDVSTGTPAAINSFIESSDFDLGDGEQFMFIKRVLPDVTFAGSTASSPAVTLTLKTRNTSGNTWISSTNEPSTNSIARTAASGSIYTSPIEQFTPQLWVRLRGRQAVLRLENNAVGVKWQLGAIRLDLRPDGRR